MKLLWGLFIFGQLLSAGNMVYQQEQGYYEVNPIYGRHPSPARIYVTKAIEIAGIWALTRKFPEHEGKILGVANTVCWGFIMADRMQGIGFEFRW